MNRLPFDYGDIKVPSSIDPLVSAEAVKRFKHMEENLRQMPEYSCAETCSECCFGTILMSYYEYVFIMDYLREKATEEELEKLIIERLGTLKEGKALLCPFLLDDNLKQHCSIYSIRPLICRVFGTEAAPCHKNISFVPFSEDMFNKAHDSIYYDEVGEFNGFFLREDLVLYQGPFDFWFLANTSEANAEALADFMEEQGSSLGAVLFDLKESNLFALKEGNKIILQD